MSGLAASRAESLWLSVKFLVLWRLCRLRPSLSCFKAADWKVKGFPHGEAAKPQEAQIRASRVMSF